MGWFGCCSRQVGWKKSAENLARGTVRSISKQVIDLVIENILLGLPTFEVW